ncbi:MULTISPECIES: M48 family metallopeptidase [unclassified Salipiger]|uniref:M48 family metallopeptidase n=1 Tax=unclassified Salipiger TaxID=2640570 RepID=UPI0013B6D5BE|nr:MULTISPECIES: SprT family zinc-dependent metalloprotease [unclassified Salipiger]NDV49164.1 M48 family metallopeptidase [Salipiger sp. PrR003]NDW31424.1 M48 family metallopeptidase [Salipiger sp. PrR007]
MGQITLPGNPPISVTLRRSAQARRLSLRLSQLDGRVTLTLPRRLPEAEAIGFLREKEGWLRGHLESRGADVAVGLGARLPFEGRAHEIRPGQGRSVRRVDGALEVPGAAQQVPARLVGWLRAEARDRLAAASDRHAAALGLPYSRLTLRDTRSRWGSCTAEGGLMYSWRLVMAPPEVLDYVAAHEVAHLAQMNHSPAFWAVVERLYGDWRPARRWLQVEGASLHRYRFGD